MTVKTYSAEILNLTDRIRAVGNDLLTIAKYQGTPGEQSQLIFALRTLALSVDMIDRTAEGLPPLEIKGTA